MVVQCSNCQTRFRVAPEKVSPKGARMRCSKCKTIFNVPPAEERPTPAQGVQRATGLVAEADPDVAKKIMSLLLSWGIPSVAVHDGCEALLKLHRERPALVILGGHLPSVSAPAMRWGIAGRRRRPGPAPGRFPASTRRSSGSISSHDRAGLRADVRAQ